MTIFKDCFTTPYNRTLLGKVSSGLSVFEGIAA